MRISGVTYIPRNNHKVRRTVIVVFILILALLIFTAVTSIITANKITHPKKIQIPLFESYIVPDYKDISFSDINNDIKLKGWFFESKGSDKTVIFAHSQGRNRLQFGIKTLDLVKNLMNSGYNVLMFDFRNSGESEGSISTFGQKEKDDILGAVKYTKSTGTKHIILFGFGEGANAGILAASASNDIETLILDTPYTDLNTYLNKVISENSKLPKLPFNKTTKLAAKLLYGIDLSMPGPSATIEELASRPILFIYSIDDKKVTAEQSKELYKSYSASSSKGTFWETGGSGHLQIYDNYEENYISSVQEFLTNIYKTTKK